MKLAIIVPRYGEAIVGGAESLARGLAERLSQAELDVEVWTTCADDLATWRNAQPAGLQRLNGVPVRRFPIDHRFRDERRYRELTFEFAGYAPGTIDKEYEWIDHSPHSPALYDHILKHGRDYDCLMFMPYIFGTTLYGATIWPERSVIWPCLHDEPFARFLHVRLLMSACRGLAFLSPPEMALARDKLGIHNPHTCVIGCGVDDFRADGDRFKRRHGLSGPFMLYAGRFDSMKNLLQLFRYFIDYKRQRPGPFKLVLMGDGPLTPPRSPDILCVGRLNETDKRDAYQAAAFVCQPSLSESFSIVIMEAWLAGTPVLIHGDCSVTRYHVLHSNGGLHYTGYEEFEGAVSWLLDHPQQRSQMGRQGRNYVLREYNWRAVIDRLRAALAMGC